MTIATRTRVTAAKAGRRWMLAAALLIGTIGLSACSPFNLACPAIGWINALTIQLDGDVSEVADVQLCIDDACVPTEDGAVPDDLAQVALDPQDGNSDEWVFTTGMSTPAAFTVRVLAADGSILTDAAVTPEWIRGGGSEQCGGPGDATVTVHL